MTTSAWKGGVSRVLMIGAAGGMCSGSVTAWGQSGPCRESLGLCISCFGRARIVYSAAECQNPPNPHGCSSKCPALGPRTAKLFLCHRKQDRKCSYLALFCCPCEPHTLGFVCNFSLTSTAQFNCVCN